MVNANLIASKRGLNVSEQKENTCENYASLITVSATTSSGAVEVAGTVLRNESHIVRVNKTTGLTLFPLPGRSVRRP